VDAGLARYFRVADVLFPRKLFEGQPYDFILTLRFLPGSHPESQIVISKTPRGGYTVTQYSLPKGSKTAYQQWVEISSESKIEDAVEITRRIKVDVRNVEVPSTFLSPQIERMAKLTLFPFEELDLGFARVDATEYQFWLQRVGDPTGFHICFKGDSYGQGNARHSLVSWMNETKALVEKYVQLEQRAK
jgi:hypothetical protein